MLSAAQKSKELQLVDKYKDVVLLYKIKKREIKLKDTMTVKGPYVFSKSVCPRNLKHILKHKHDIGLFVGILEADKKYCDENLLPKYQRDCRRAASSAYTLIFTYQCGITPEVRDEAIEVMDKACKLGLNKRYRIK